MKTRQEKEDASQIKHGEWQDLRQKESEDAYNFSDCAICGDSNSPKPMRFGPCGGIDDDIYPYHIVNKYTWTFCAKHHDSIDKEVKDLWEEWLDNFENVVYDILRAYQGDQRMFYLQIMSAVNRAVELESKWRLKK